MIWDIEMGVMLNYFVENCGHIGFPHCNSTVLDGRFSPDGLNFAVATYYGTFSVYGYGDGDMFMPTPKEQFYKHEHDKFEIEESSYRLIDSKTQHELHTVDKGPICNVIGIAYANYQPEEGKGQNVFEEAYSNRYRAAETRDKLQSNAKDSNSKECVASIAAAVNKLIIRDSDLLREQLKQSYKGKLSGVTCEIDMKDLLLMTNETIQLASNSKSTRAVEHARKVQINEEDNAMEPAE